MGTTSRSSKQPPIAELIKVAYENDQEFRDDLNRTSKKATGSRVPFLGTEMDMRTFDEECTKLMKKYPFSKYDLFAFMIKGEWKEDKYISVEIPEGIAERGFTLDVIGRINKQEFISIWDTEISPRFLNKRRNRGVDNPLLAYSVAKAKMKGISSQKIANQLTEGTLHPFNGKRQLTYQDIDRIYHALKESLRS